MDEHEVKEAEERVVEAVRDFFTGDLEWFDEIVGMGDFAIVCELWWKNERTSVGYWFSDARRWVQRGLLAEAIWQLNNEE